MDGEAINCIVPGSFPGYFGPKCIWVAGRLHYFMMQTVNKCLLREALY